MQELVQAAEDRLVYRQVESVRAEKATLRCSREIQVRRQWSPVTLWCFFCIACWETCQSRYNSMVPEMSVCQTNSSLHSETLRD